MSKRPMPPSLSNPDSPKRLKLAVDILSSDEHDQLNAIVNEKASNAGITDSDSVPLATVRDAALLLGWVVYECKGMNQEYAEDLFVCITLLKDNPEIHTKLREAFDCKKYNNIRNIEILRDSGSTLNSKTITRRRLSPNMEPNHDRLIAAHVAFHAEWKGDSHVRLNTLMGTLRKVQDDVYNHSLSIVQSSGFGKSRTVDAAAGLKFAFPFNLREPLHNHSTYPPADSDVRSFFLRLEKESDNDVKLRHACFLAKLFELATAELNKALETRSNGSTIPERWKAHLAEGELIDEVGVARQDFYSRVLSEAKVLVSEHHGLISSDPKLGHLRTLLNEKCTAFCSDLRQKLERSNVPQDKDLAIQDPIFFMYFDESHDLTKLPATSSAISTRSAFHVLGHVLSWMVTQPLFTIFLSTNSWLAGFAPSSSRHPSARDWDSTLLHTPFTGLPFDTFAIKSLSRLKEAKNNQVKLEDVCELEYLVQFGRPLWAAQYKHGNEIVKRDIVTFARGKLSPDVEMSPNAKYAALGVRIMLEFDAAREDAREIEGKLVETFLRVVFAVPDHRQYMRTGAPSEPLLAEAAARLLNPNGNNRMQVEAPTVLSQAFEKGHLARGERGEMVARLLWTLAHDAVVNAGLRRKDSNFTGDITYHRPIPVVDFLLALYHPKWHATILEAKPVGDPDGKMLKDAFEDVYLNFSHFARAGDYDVISADWLWRALLRGMAFQCADNQKSTDLVAPAHHGKNAIICKENTSLINGQIKNQKTKTSVLVNPLVGGKPENDKPVLSMVMELGIQESDLEITSVSYPRTRSGKASIHINHYQIVAYGATHETYKVIPKEMDAYYTSILAATKVSDDFPEHGDLETLYRQKPAFYTEQEVSYDWSH